MMETLSPHGSEGEQIQAGEGLQTEGCAWKPALQYHGPALRFAHVELIPSVTGLSLTIITV